MRHMFDRLLRPPALSNFRLELAYLLPEGAKCALQSIDHQAEAIGQLPDLVLSVHLNRRRKVAGVDCLGSSRKGLNRPHNSTHGHERERRGGRQSDHEESGDGKDASV